MPNVDTEAPIVTRVPEKPCPCENAPCSREHRITGPIEAPGTVGIYVCVRCGNAFVRFAGTVEEAVKILAEVESENV